MADIEGHAQHVCADGHEECAVTAGGLCGRPHPDFDTFLAAQLAMFEVAATAGHRAMMYKVLERPLDSPPGTMVLIWECRCGLRCGVLHAYSTELYPERGTCWRIDGKALRQHHREPLRGVSVPAPSYELPHLGGTR